MVPFHTQFFWVFLGFYLVQLACYLSLEILNYRYVKAKKDYPDCYQGFISDSVFTRSKAYTLEKIQFGITAHLGTIPFFWFLIFRNGFNTFDYYAALHAGYGTLSHSVLFCVYTAIYFGIVALPFKIYSTFVIEEKYGFNHVTPKIFLVDGLKSMVLSIVLGVPLLYTVFWFMREAGPLWWLWVWALMMGFQFVMTAVYPVLLAPIFNKFVPLNDGDLVERITKLAKEINFKMSGVFTIDGSRRSAHSNAYFAGMGRFRRIVLFDTLTQSLTNDELVGVLAHEMGHNVKKHIVSMTVISGLLSLVTLYGLSLLLGLPDFFAAFNLHSPSVHAALVIFMLCSDVFLFMLTPLMNKLSRRHEFEADRFAREVTGDAKSLSVALVKLARDNLSNLTPHPLYSFFHHSHPTVEERVRALS